MQRKIHTVEIDNELCKGCERCVHACPKKLLKMDGNVNSMGLPVAIYVGEGCIGCGACFYGCPEAGAITVFEVTPDEVQ
jgi:NAD-dependent dihydropyrimidine dehydrogenase PreA subunit